MFKKMEKIPYVKPEAEIIEAPVESLICGSIGWGGGADDDDI